MTLNMNINSLFESHLVCPICYEYFIYPTSLHPCAHTFCDYCLWRWKKSQDEDVNRISSRNTCPVCRAAILGQSRSAAFENMIEGCIESWGSDCFTSEERRTARRELLSARKDALVRREEEEKRIRENESQSRDQYDTFSVEVIDFPEFARFWHQREPAESADMGRERQQSTNDRAVPPSQDAVDEESSRRIDDFNPQLESTVEINESTRQSSESDLTFERIHNEISLMRHGIHSSTVIDESTELPRVFEVEDIDQRNSNLPSHTTPVRERIDSEVSFGRHGIHSSTVIDESIELPRVFEVEDTDQRNSNLPSHTTPVHEYHSTSPVYHSTTPPSEMWDREWPIRRERRFDSTRDSLLSIEQVDDASVPENNLNVNQYLDLPDLSDNESFSLMHETSYTSVGEALHNAYDEVENEMSAIARRLETLTPYEEWQNSRMGRESYNNVPPPAESVIEMGTPEPVERASSPLTGGVLPHESIFDNSFESFHSRSSWENAYRRRHFDNHNWIHHGPRSRRDRYAYEYDSENYISRSENNLTRRGNSLLQLASNDSHRNEVESHMALISSRSDNALAQAGNDPAPIASSSNWTSGTAPLSHWSTTRLQRDDISTAFLSHWSTTRLHAREYSDAWSDVEEPDGSDNDCIALN